MKEFFLCFVPLFVAVDAIGVLPLFISLTEEVNRKQIFRIVIQSFITAHIVAIVFLLLGQFIFSYLGISTYDFMIAGGIILFVISIRDILSSEKKHRAVDEESVGAVPIGVPLIVGPAVLTTSILLVNQYGFFLPMAALSLNIIIACALFLTSQFIIKLLGKPGTKTVSKIASLILAAIAVMMVRKGLLLVLKL